MSYTLPLQGKRIAVIGAGLLGAKICKAVSAAGAALAVVDVDEARAVAIALELAESCPSRILSMGASIVDRESIEAMLDGCERELGGLDGVVNTAYPRNRNYGRKFEDVQFKDFCENVNLHLGGYFLVAQRVLERFARRDGGNLINISSIYGVIAPRFEVYEGTPMTMPVEYAAIKSAIIHLTKYMAKYYAGRNIRVNALSLGGLHDGQPAAFIQSYRNHSLNKGMLAPEDILGAVVFLLSDASRYVNGQNLIVDDGFTL